MWSLSLLALLLALAPVVWSAETDPSAAFQAGVLAYQNKDYAKALETFNTLVKSGHQSAALYYNLGCAYYRTGNTGRALLNFEKALLLDPHDEDVHANIEFVRALALGSHPEGDQNLLSQIVNAVYQAVSPNEIGAIILGLYLMGTGLWLWRIFSEDPGRRKTLGVLLVIIGFAWGNFSAWGYVKYRDEFGTTRAIVLSQKGELMSGPGPGFEVIFNVSEGAKVEILDERSGYCLVKNPDLGYRGWINKNALGII